MSGAPEPKPWFRVRDTGGGYTPASWQGWLVMLAFILVLATTGALILPEGSRKAAAFPQIAAARHALGLTDMGLGLGGGLATMALEVGVFLLICWWTSRPVRPLD